ncbi:Decarbamoylnovobiocin carbamoyltransferase [Rubripirellula tenax]|uniref:Decarbamoylnovobiocin carbamoyltransferase n=1 Tax=Rubripirellula tenax TaxID=2528015 RepID=A0A5C6FLF0_9BACT|nr:carbamoyltransferase N-terminal domain-containing protein [Rubripirellula tenax]TWU60624.1 Decarbamoylnovobiocin carbamoyltransferase [Rubripirellula tenax]
MTAILGLSAFFHDSAAALVVDGRVVAAAQEERFSRIKHDAAFPTEAIQACLELGGVKPDDLDHVAFYEKPLLKFDRLLETYADIAPRGVRSFTTAMPSWLQQKLHVRREVRRGLGNLYHGPIAFFEHHESHAASAFYASPFDEAAIMTMDGVGEWATTTIGIGSGEKIQLSKEIRFPDSIGLLYSAFTYHAGFRVNSGEYKLMGLAPYGTPRFATLIRERLISICDDGSFRLDSSYFNYRGGLTMTNAKFDRLFGRKRRDPSETIEAFHRDMAASIQCVTEEAVMKAAIHLKEISGQSKLCLAGGVALNCVANGKLLREGPFDDVWVQPAAGDAGGAVGAAMLVWHQVMRQPRSVSSSPPFDALLGPEYSDASVREALDRSGLQFERLDDESLAHSVVADLADGKVIGRFDGRMEFGPRALGNRSILADPRGAETQSRINQKIKFRESFRPFAPAILANHVEACLDTGGHAANPYMMFVHPMRGSDVPAVTHVDGTARVQSVDARDNVRFERLLRCFFEATGCPMLVNTSFNVRGEPIVGSPDDAIRCFLKTDLDVLVIENFVVRSKVGAIAPTFDVVKGHWLDMPRKIFRLWNRVVGVIGLSAVYYLVVTPVGWARRVGRTSRESDDTSSYWRHVDADRDPKRHLRTY